MTIPDSQRIVVTGLGPVSPVGSGKEAFWNAIRAGADGSGEVMKFDTSMYKVHRACEVKDFRPRSLQGDPGPATQLAVAAVELALEDARLPAPRDDARSPLRHAGVVIGTTGGEIPVLEKMNRQRFGPHKEAVDPADFPKYPCHVIAANVARHYGFRGPNQVVPTACAAGNYAISIGFEWLRSGRAPFVLAGGADPLSVVSFTGFGRMFAIAADRCRPFDKNRKGILPGEGAGILVLETLESARRRGARVYAEVRGYGLSCDAYHPTMPHPEGAGVQLAMRRAMQQAGLQADDVDYISAHGTGTQANDKIESSAIRAVLGAAARKTPISSIKSMIGHTMGAASALEAIVCSLAVDTGWIPPTMNYETPDPDCDLDYVPNKAREKRVQVALNNAYAFGGNNSCVVFASPGA
ncbi:MAG: beta-ketoacyl-[acyl-carrier-protein] synthase family protein [Planctomycetota bacterium]|nr:MAG: beta-ketoacyl-[acyl-carrier-protein] synthase family protein [Planctomycetota bacterium]